MISTIKNNIKKDSNPKIKFLNRFSCIVNQKLEENIVLKKEKAFYDNVFFIMIYGLSVLFISASLSVFLSLFSTAFIFSMLPKDMNEIFIGSIGFCYLFLSCLFVFVACRYSYHFVASLAKKIPFLKNITNYFEEKNKIKDNSLDCFLKEKVLPVSSKQIDFMNEIIQKIDKVAMEKILSGLKKESPNVISKLKVIFNKIEKNEKLEVNEKIFLMSKLSVIESSKYDIVFDLLKK